MNYTHVIQQIWKIKWNITKSLWNDGGAIQTRDWMGFSDSVPIFAKGSLHKCR